LENKNAFKIKEDTIFMIREESLDKIDGDIAILQIQKELIESEGWDDKTHLERKYDMHVNSFYNVIKQLCPALGIFNVEKEEKGNYKLKLQSGQERIFDIGRDYNNQKGKDKLISYTEINDNTHTSTLLWYSPNQGVNFEYSAQLMHRNIQLGKNDFFGKSIENMIKEISSSTDGIDFYTRIDRFDKAPHGLKDFCIATGKDTKGFIPKEKQGDVISAIATLDGIVRGLNSIPQPWLYGPNFLHEKEEPLFNMKIKITI
jgi:hypothetical protein